MNQKVWIVASGSYPNTYIICACKDEDKARKFAEDRAKKDMLSREYPVELEVVINEPNNDPELTICDGTVYLKAPTKDRTIEFYIRANRRRESYQLTVYPIEYQLTVYPIEPIGD